MINSHLNIAETENEIQGGKFLNNRAKNHYTHMLYISGVFFLVSLIAPLHIKVYHSAVWDTGHTATPNILSPLLWEEYDVDDFSPPPCGIWFGLCLDIFYTFLYQYTKQHYIQIYYKRLYMYWMVTCAFFAVPKTVCAQFQVYNLLVPPPFPFS